MPYQYVREPLTAAEPDRPSNACETPTERLVVWTLLDTRLRVGELCDLTSRSVLWQQRQLQFKGKCGPQDKKSKVRVVPMSDRVRTLLDRQFAPEKAFPVKTRRAQDIVKAVANRAGLTKDVSPHVLRHPFATTALQKGISLPTVQKILGYDRLQTTAIYPNFTDVPHTRMRPSGGGENRPIPGLSSKLDGLALFSSPLLTLLANSSGWSGTAVFPYQ
jgi:integrase/recombinase XerD